MRLKYKHYKNVYMAIFSFLHANLLTNSENNCPTQYYNQGFILDKIILDTPSPEICASKIFEASGAKFDADVATDLWQKIMQHKWVLSERLNRDVGFKIACTDFLENIGTDEELSTHISSCKLYLMSCGIDPSYINDESNPMVSTLIIIYVKTFFGFKNDGSAKELPKTFDMLVGQIALTKGAIENVS